MQFFAVEEMVAADSWEKVIDVFVDILPLRDPGFKHATLKKEGRPPCNGFTDVETLFAWTQPWYQILAKARAVQLNENIAVLPLRVGSFL
jgi:hypothetical protein